MKNIDSNNMRSVYSLSVSGESVLDVSDWANIAIQSNNPITVSMSIGIEGDIFNTIDEELNEIKIYEIHHISTIKIESESANVYLAKF